MSRHVAPASSLTLVAESLEKLTCEALLIARVPIPIFDTGRHCEAVPPLCVMGSDAVGTFIAHTCGLGVERLVGLA